MVTFPAIYFILLIITANVLIMSILAARLKWQDFSTSKKPWQQTTCNIIAAEVVTCTITQSTKFDIKFNISTDHKFPPPNDSPIADTGISACREDDLPNCKQNCEYKSEQEAEQAIESFKGPSVPCWAAPFKQSIRLQQGGTNPAQINRYRDRAIVFTVATIVVILVNLFLFYKFISSVIEARRHPEWVGTPLRIPTDIFPMDHSTNMHSSRRRPLSKRDARAFMATLIVDDAPEKGGTCAICLEEFEGHQKLVKLPCDHFYHAECASQWFGKGGSFCPYCHYDVLPDVREMRDRDIVLHERFEESSSDDPDHLSTPPRVAVQADADSR